MKLYRNIIIVIALLAILGGALYFIAHYNPDTASETSEVEEQSSDMMNVYKANSGDVVEIYIKNADEEYSLTRDSNEWLLNGDASIRIKQTAADSIAYSCTSVSVKQTVSGADSSAEQFGFLAPLGYAKVSFKDGSSKTITVGSLSLDKENYYVMLSDDPNVYLKNTYGTESMIPNSSTLRDLLLFSIDSSNLSDLRHFYMAKQGNTPVKMEYTNTGTEDDPNMQWKMLEPVYAEINGQVFVDSILGKLESFSAAHVIEDHPKNLAVYGLDAPYATFSIGTAEGTSAFRLGNETENYRYIIEDGYETVYIVKKSDLTFLDTAYMDLMSNLIHVEYIDTVNTVEIISPDSTHKMEIKGENGNNAYYIDGTSVKKEQFSKAYQAVIGISLDSLDLSEEPDIRPDAQILYHKKDGSVITVAFLPVDERNFRVTVDGRGNSVTNKKNFTDVITKIEDTVAQAK